MSAAMADDEAGGDRRDSMWRNELFRNRQIGAPGASTRNKKRFFETLAQSGANDAMGD